MTSVLRRYDQIEPRIRYLLVNQAVNPALPTTNLSSGGVTAFTVPQGTFGPIDTIHDANMASITGAVVTPLAVGQLYRDTGRSLYVYDVLGAGGTQVAIFRQVILMRRGYGSEGINNWTGPSIYIKVWAATGTGILVSRVG